MARRSPTMAEVGEPRQHRTGEHQQYYRAEDLQQWLTIPAVIGQLIDAF